MIQIEGLWWPDGTRHSQCEHALMHVKSADWAITHCKQLRTAIQAGGNVGLWPRRMAQSFQRVVTFEPDVVSRECLRLNVPDNVDVHTEAIGHDTVRVGLARKSLGSHRINVDGDDVQQAFLDGLELPDVDLIQLDVEGYEMRALQGATETIVRCQPLIQVELRETLLEKYCSSAGQIRGWMRERGYRQVSAQQGSDFVFAPKGWAA